MTAMLRFLVDETMSGAALLALPVAELFSDAGVPGVICGSLAIGGGALAVAAALLFVRVGRNL